MHDQVQDFSVLLSNYLKDEKKKPGISIKSSIDLSKPNEESLARPIKSKIAMNEITMSYGQCLLGV